MKASRRQFLILSATSACAIALNTEAQAQAMVSPSDPQAVALGYVSDAAKADKAKFPKYAAGQQCSACALYQGKPGRFCQKSIKRFRSSNSLNIKPTFLCGLDSLSTN